MQILFQSKRRMEIQGKVRVSGDPRLSLIVSRVISLHKLQFKGSCHPTLPVTVLLMKIGVFDCYCNI
jgi:hypothetical protein